MNPLHWLENHPNAALAAVIGGSIALLFFAAWLIHWYVIDARYWLDWLPRHQADRRADREWERISAISDDDWQRMADAYDEWEPEPWTDADADRLIADLTTDLPGPVPEGARDAGQSRRAGELHLEPWLERGWWDDPDLTVWDARQAALRCWEILHIEFPRLRAELGCPA